MAMDIVTNDHPGHGNAKPSATGANRLEMPDRITNSVMIEIDPMLEMGSMVVAGMMNSLEEIAS